MEAAARSLWNDSCNLVADQRPKNVGDIVTVVVNEKTKTKDQGKTDVSKSNNSSVADGLGILDFIRAFGFSSKSNMKGDGSTERTHTAQTQITCLVTDILPNGNLIIDSTLTYFSSVAGIGMGLLNIAAGVGTVYLGMKSGS